MPMPKDPVILLSCVNTSLRDHYASLEEFCEREDIDCEHLCRVLGELGYEYDAKQNRFR